MFVAQPILTSKEKKKVVSEIAELETQLRNTQAEATENIELDGDQIPQHGGVGDLQMRISRIDSRMNELHALLNNALVASEPKDVTEVQIGARVTILRDGTEETWEIVGWNQSNPKEGKIAYNTPLARVLLTKKEGDVAKELIGTRRTTIRVLEVSTAS